jgi:D-alanyl-lipoteichoic acid acyltransferase DltB (MBOAT superfamily)
VRERAVAVIFSSIEFIYVFLPIVFGLFVLSRRVAGVGVALGLLTLASFVYYAYWKIDYLWILLGSIAANYLIARVVGPGRRWNTARMLAGVGANLGLLFWFKYAAFTSGVIADLGLIEQGLAARALPLGISFFTFQQIAYLVDRARGRAPRHSLLKHALFVSFFPQLIAGPIVHHSEMMPQLEQPRASWEGLSTGLFIFGIGLFKKVVIADSLAPLVEAGFADPGALATINAWAVVIAYTLQLYFDFSGYSDMAVGLGLMFGVRLPWNFLSPYKATSIGAFWRTWHVTLSNFLKDYVYIPLGGSHHGHWRTLVSLMVTMVLGGIWHGAGWTFLLWGVLHGVALSINYTWRLVGVKLPRVVGWALTFGVVVLGWVLFRASSIGDAWTMYAGMAGAGVRLFDGSQQELYRASAYGALGLVLVLACPSTAQLSGSFKPRPFKVLLGAAALAIAMVHILGRTTSPEFLYFDF